MDTFLNSTPSQHGGFTGPYASLHISNYEEAGSQTIGLQELMIDFLKIMKTVVTQ